MRDHSIDLRPRCDVPKIALPNKGRLNEDIRVLLRDAGLDVRSHDERALVASLGEDFSAIFVRAQDIPEFVADGAADAGITGYDCVLESERELDTLLDLGLGRCRLAVAMPMRDAARGLDALPADARVATCFPALTRRFFASQRKPVRVVVVSGAAEVTPELGVADAIVDLVATGSTLKVNGLVEVATIVESTARLVTKPRARVAEEVARALDELAMALASVLAGRGQRYVMANVPRAALDAVRALLPGLNGPTVVDVLGGAFVAVHAVVPQAMVYRTTLGLKALGCEGILVTRIERLIP
jgi:ATP phosphoribosyltransferase